LRELPHGFKGQIVQRQAGNAASSHGIARQQFDDRIPALFNSWAIVFRRRLGDYRWLKARDDRPGIGEDIIPCTPDIDLVRSSRRISRPSGKLVKESVGTEIVSLLHIPQYACKDPAASIEHSPCRLR
jgi:hypothetical protein